MQQRIERYTQDGWETIVRSKASKAEIMFCCVVVSLFTLGLGAVCIGMFLQIAK